jgi:hypothetical protein
MHELLFTSERDCKAPELTGIIITAIPAGRKWRLKTLNLSGDSAKLPDIFTSRLEALGAGVLLAGKCGGWVIP